MQKGFGSAPKKKLLKDSRYLKFYNDEKDVNFYIKLKFCLILRYFKKFLGFNNFPLIIAS